MPKPAIGKKEIALLIICSENLTRLRTISTTSLQQRIGDIEQAARKSRRITLGATLLLVGLGAVFAYCLYSKISMKGPPSMPLARMRCWAKVAVLPWRKVFGVSK